MEEEQLLGPESPLRKAKPEDDEWSLQVLVLPLPGLLHSLQGTPRSTFALMKKHPPA